MKAILFSLGTRGDIEPFLAIAQMLREDNWEVICSFPEQFKGLVEEIDLPFAPLSKKFIEILESEEGKMVLGGKGSIFKRIKALGWMIRASKAVNREIVAQQHKLILHENPDRVIYNLKCTYPVIWGMAHPGKSIIVSPIPCLIHFVKDQAVIGFKGNFGARINRLTYNLHNFGLIQNIYATIKSYRSTYHEIKFKPKSVKKFILGVRILYSISPSLFPRPEYWPDQARIVGYIQRNKSWSWHPDSSLTEFLKHYKKILFISFGSMTNPEPEQTTAIILKVLTKNRIPAIINTASGGLSRPPEFPDHVLFIDKIPYEWILPKVYAVLHHGGSGTTHISFKSGCAMMIIPHILDQHFWNDRVVRLQAGPKGFSIRKLSIKKLEPKLLDLMQNITYRENAIRIANRMVHEDEKRNLIELLIQ